MPKTYLDGGLWTSMMYKRMLMVNSVLALANGGLNDIIVNQTNGFLAKTPLELQGYVKKVYKCC